MQSWFDAIEHHLSEFKSLFGPIRSFADNPEVSVLIREFLGSIEGQSDARSNSTTARDSDGLRAQCLDLRSTARVLGIERMEAAFDAILELLNGLTPDWGVVSTEIRGAVTLMKRCTT